jgi:hypothetical protein
MESRGGYQLDELVHPWFNGLATPALQRPMQQREFEE